MKHTHRQTFAVMVLTVSLAAPAIAGDVARFAVNEYFGMTYRREPVSFDVTLPEPVPATRIGLRSSPWQVEIVEGTPQAVRKARVWTLVDFDANSPRQVLFTVHTDADGEPKGGLVFAEEGKIAGVAIARVSNGRISALVPVGSIEYETPASPFDCPGPVVSITRDGTNYVGAGYIDSTRRVERITCEISRGPVYLESRIHYAFEGDRHYKARVRLYEGKPYVQLAEDFNLGGASRFVFNYGDWFADAFFRTGDNKLCGWEPITRTNPCADFVRIEGQEALARMVIWTQFNYFGGKQETIALKAPDPKALHAAHREAVAKHQRDLKRYREQVAQQDRRLEDYRRQAAEYPAKLQEYRKQLAAHRADPKKVRRPKEPRRLKPPRERHYRKPREPVKAEYAEVTHTLAGAAIRATSAATPGGDSTAVGAFYVRPDRWTRAKVNHVDMYMRPEVPSDRMTRGIVGLAGAKLRIAMEAWLVDGHREWAIFAVRSGESTWLAKAHVQEGVWPLDRIRRLPLVWNSDGSKVRPEDTRPPKTGAAPGVAGRVLLSTRGRSGLQTFNGSEGGIRGTRPPAEGWDGTVKTVRAAAGSADNLAMAGQAMTAYLAADDSAYPSFRAMLPWTDPEAINPFYQGMENMNFNADLYRYITTHGLRLAAMGHPDWKRFVEHGEKSLDMALDRYVYPDSGCWEESHGYAGHTIHTVAPLAVALKNTGRRNFLEDVRFARMLEFFLYVHSPIDAEWGNRVVPAIGDHGQSRAGPAERLGRTIGVFADSKHPEIRRIVRRAAWMIREDGGAPPPGVKCERPDLTSRWLRGYGTVMRATGQSEGSCVTFELKGALLRKDGRKDALHDLYLTLRRKADGPWDEHVRGKAPTYNTAGHVGTCRAAGANGAAELHLDVTVNDDRWIKGGQAKYVIRLAGKGEAQEGTYSGRFNDRQVAGKYTARTTTRAKESFLVLRAGQSWGHHHEDKGSMWFWGRNVHFFGDCDWGAPPGGTYWNRYKQGPAGGTQIELVGVTNWTLPCKYPAPWISDDACAADYDYANARCMYPFNPKLDLSRSTPVALRSGYDRQVLFVHPAGPEAADRRADLLIVRDNVETMCPTIWRMHSFQPQGTTVRGSRATLASPQKVIGELAILYPRDGVKLRRVDRDILNAKYFDADGRPLPFEQLPKFKSSVELRWDMPPNTSATWLFAVHGADEHPPQAELLDKEGRVTRINLPDGREITALLNIEPFKYSAPGIDFQGTVGLVIRKAAKTTAHPIRAEKLTAR